VVIGVVAVSLAMVVVFDLQNASDAWSWAVAICCGKLAARAGAGRQSNHVYRSA